MDNIISSRAFTELDQAEFARISGDFNPIHVDTATARRSGPGALIVHGIHNLLWCIDTIAPAIPGGLSVSGLRVNFDTFVSINEQADVVLVQTSVQQLRAEVRVRGTLALTALIYFGDTLAALPAAKPVDLVNPLAPMDVQF
ncbi:MAG TPA: MaoC family dehydratase, partial [Acetobacteraceae bacterium]|nr:MaoC family dehydratase [Acetobacteraceae bacterium]